MPLDLSKTPNVPLFDSPQVALVISDSSIVVPDSSKSGSMTPLYSLVLPLKKIHTLLTNSILYNLERASPLKVSHISTRSPKVVSTLNQLKTSTAYSGAHVTSVFPDESQHCSILRSFLTSYKAWILQQQFYDWWQRTQNYRILYSFEGPFIRYKNGDQSP